MRAKGSVQTVVASSLAGDVSYILLTQLPTLQTTIVEELI